MFTRDRSNIEADSRSKITSEEIVCQFIQDLDAGEFPCPETIAAQYPALAPALLQDLRIALSIHSARQEATREEIPYTETEEFSKEIARLQEELPAFSLLCRLEHGGQGAVYKAIQVSTGRTVALKILLDVPIFAGKRRERFEREIELVSRLQHPNIVTIFESGVVVDRPFYAMEYIDGLPIDDYFLANRPTVEEAARIFSMITRAVAHAHKRGIIHRDLKPLNILVDLDGQPHVLDFGLAKELESQSDSNGGISITGQVVGTLPYLSPEQASGDPDEVDTRSDVYSLGVIFYRLLTGTYPYVVEGDPNIVRANILASEPKSFKKTLDGADPAIRSTADVAHDDIERIVLKSLSKDKERRYQSADALADDLDRFARGEAVLAKADSTIYVLRKTLRKYRLQVAFAATLAVVLAVSSIVAGIQWRHAATERDNAREIALLAHEALNDMVGKIEKRISTLAGGAKVRNEILAGVANQLERLRPRLEYEASSLPIFAQLREKQGDIAGMTAKVDEARAAYNDFLKLSLRLDNNTFSSAFVPNIIKAYRKLALLPSENSAKQEELFQRGVAIAQKKLQSIPNSDEMQFECCSIVIEYAQFLYKCGKIENASSELLGIKPFILKNEFQNPESAEWGELASVYYGLWGKTLGEKGDADGSLENLIHCMRIRSKLSKEDPANVDLRDKFRFAQMNLADQYRLMSRFDDAIELLKAAVVTGDYLLLTESDSLKWKVNLFQTYQRLVNLYLDMSKIDEAIKCCKEITKLSTSLESSDTSVSRPYRVKAYKLMAKIHIKEDQSEKAKSDLECALENQEILASDSNVTAKKELTLILDLLGHCHSTLKNTKAALACYNRAYEIRKRLAFENPNVLNNELNIVVSLTNLATIDKKHALILLDEAEMRLEILLTNGMIDDDDKRYREFSKSILRIKNNMKKHIPHEPTKLDSIHSTSTDKRLTTTP